MKITSIIDIVDGELKNTPSISFIYNIKINAKKIQEGDLYIAKNSKDLDLAVKNGAFAILYDFDTEVYDNEIAWIKVDSYENALIKLFRFKLSNVDLEAYYCDKISYEILSIYNNISKNMKFITSNLENSIKIIENINDNDIIFCTNLDLLKKIYPNYSNFVTAEHNVENLIKHSIFETSFSYQSKYFSKLKISSLYINQFISVYNFLNCDFDFLRLKNFNHFKPIFIDKFINLVEFGRSDKLIISQKDLSLVNNEIKYIKENYKYAKTIYITSKFINEFPEEQLVISNLKKLKEFLKTKKFNAIYLVGYDKSKIEKSLTSSFIEKSLI